MKNVMVTLCFTAVVVAASAAWAIDIEGTAVVVPVAMHGPGALGTSWRTDLWISNWTMGRQEVTATLYPTSGEPVTTTFDVGSADTVELRDVVLSTFGLANAKGMILLTVDTPFGFQATARIYNVGNPMGEFGQFVPGIAIARLERQAFVAGLAGVDGNRSNFGIANPNDLDVDVTVYVLDSHGDLLHTEEMTVGATSVVQVNDLFAELGVPPQRGLQLDMHTAGGMPIYGYASVVRNDTGDAIFIFGTSPNN